MISRLLSKLRNQKPTYIDSLPTINKIDDIPMYSSPYIDARNRVGQDLLNQCAADPTGQVFSMDQVWELHPDFPLAACFNVHSLCNERCIMCPYKFTEADQPTRKMQFAKFEQIWDEFLEIGGKIATFNNFSDIFAHQSGMEYVRHTLKNLSKAQIYFVTNALALKKAYVDEILSTGWQGIIYVSCHGFSAETFEKVTGANGFSHVMKNARYLVDSHPMPDRIIIQYATDFSSEDEIKAARDFWGQLGCTVNFFQTHTFGGSSRHREQLTMPGYLAGCRGWGYDAGQPFFQAVIQQNGNLTLCCHDLQGKIVIGNVFESGLANVWKSKEMRNILRLIYRGSNDPRTMSICRKCGYGQLVEH